MLGVAGMIGADARVPAMVLMRAPLGSAARGAPTVLNAAQCIGWAIFELLDHRHRGRRALRRAVRVPRRSGCGRSSSAGSRCWLALIGPIGFVRKFVRKFAAWAVLGVAAVP